MFIGRTTTDLIVLWEESTIKSQLDGADLKFVSKHEICINNLRELFARIPKGWIEAKTGYLVNADLELLAIYKQMFSKKDNEKCRLKLVRFPNAADPFIRLCSKGSCMKNYKNTVLLPNHLINAFCSDAKKYDWTEVRKSVNPNIYEYWSKYIDENEQK